MFEEEETQPLVEDKPRKRSRQTSCLASTTGINS